LIFVEGDPTETRLRHGLRPGLVRRHSRRRVRVGQAVPDAPREDPLEERQVLDLRAAGPFLAEGAEEFLDVFERNLADRVQPLRAEVPTDDTELRLVVRVRGRTDLMLNRGEPAVKCVLHGLDLDRPLLGALGEFLGLHPFGHGDAGHQVAGGADIPWALAIRILQHERRDLARGDGATTNAPGSVLQEGRAVRVGGAFDGPVRPGAALSVHGHLAFRGVVLEPRRKSCMIR